MSVESLMFIGAGSITLNVFLLVFLQLFHRDNRKLVERNEELRDMNRRLMYVKGLRGPFPNNVVGNTSVYKGSTNRKANDTQGYYKGTFKDSPSLFTPQIMSSGPTTTNSGTDCSSGDFSGGGGCV